MRTGLGVAVMAVSLAGCAETFLNRPPPPGSWPAPAPQAGGPPAVGAPTLTLDIPDPIAADPAAQRFAALRALSEAGAVAPEEMAARRNANLGALLPYDQPPPAAGLDQPLPVVEMAGRLAQLAGQPGTEAERDLLLDRLLPQAPRQRALPPPRDDAALRQDRARTDTLASLGLISPTEAAREQAAIAAIEQTRPTRLQPPAVTPAKPPAAKARPHPPRRPRPAAAGTSRAAAAPVPAATKPEDVPGGAIPASGKGPVGVHLLSMASPSTTDMAVTALKRDNPELAALTFKTVKTVIPDLGTTYRLLAGPIAPAEAESLCRTLRTRGQSCVVSDFDDH